MRTRPTRSRQKKDILLTDIKYNSTCLTLDIPFSLCCDICKPIKEAANGLLKNSSKTRMKKRYRDTTERWRCQQPWASCNLSDTSTIGKVNHCKKVRDFLKIETDITIKNYSVDHSRSKRARLDLVSTPSNNSNAINLNNNNNVITRNKNMSKPSDPPSVRQSTPTRLDSSPPANSPSADDNSCLYTKILTRELNQLRRDAKLAEAIRKKLKKKQYAGSTLATRLIAIAMMHAPKLGLKNASKMIPFFIASFLSDCGIVAEELPNIPKVTPSENQLKKIMIDEAVDQIYILQNEFKQKYLTLMCDKGEGKSKRSGASFVKLIAKYDKKQERIVVYNIGIESAENDSIGAAKAIDHALKTFDLPEEKITIANHGTDAGGGGTRKDLLVKLVGVGRVSQSQVTTYIHSTCALHGLNLCLSSPTILVMGDGGLLKRNAMQTLHSAYNLSVQYDEKEWADVWMLVTGTRSQHVKCPVMTRWECVGDAANHVCKYLEQWKVVSNHIVHAEKSGNTKHTIASYLSSYLEEPMIIAHINFLNAYCNCWWNKHFHWQKHVSQRTKAHGFLAVDMAVHYYVQDRDLNNLIDNWMDMEEFEGFINNFDSSSSDYSKEQFASEFFRRVRERHDKHFAQWINEYLHLCIAGDTLPAQYVCKWILGRPLIQPDCPESSYESSVHKTTINITDVGSFLTAKASLTEQRGKEFYSLHKAAIIEIADGASLWESDSENLKSFREYVKEKWLVVCTNTQLVERWVKDANECTYSGKDEYFSSLIGICRAGTVFQYNIELQESDRELKGNRFYSSGKKGERICKKTGEQEVSKRGQVQIGTSIYSSFVIEKTIQRHRLFEAEEDISKERKKKIRRRIMDKEKRFLSERNEATTEVYANHLFADTTTTKNATQKQRGFDTTVCMKGEILYSSFRTSHVPLVRAEIISRGGVFEARWKIKKLVSVLCEIVVEEQKKEIQETTGNNSPKEEELNRKSFFPISRPRDEWFDDIDGG